VQSALAGRPHHLDNSRLPNDPGPALYRVAHNASSGVPAESRSPQALEQSSLRLLKVGTAGLPCFHRRGADDLLRIFGLAAMTLSEIPVGHGAEDAVRLQHRGDRTAAFTPKQMCTSAWRAPATASAR